MCKCQASPGLIHSGEGLLILGDNSLILSSIFRALRKIDSV